MVRVKPIRNDADHKAALARVDELWGAAEGSEAGDLLEVLAILIDDYERTRWPADRVEPVAAIRAHMEMNGYVQGDLAKLIGSDSRASEILNRRRRLTVEMIAKLTNEWRLPADWLVQPYEIQSGKNEAEGRNEFRPIHLSGKRFPLKRLPKAGRQVDVVANRTKAREKA